MAADARARRTLRTVLAITFLASIGTGVYWHGLSFVARHAYGYEQVHTLVLYAVLGLLYAVAAFAAAGLVRRVACVASPRSVLASVLAAQCAVAPLPVLLPGELPLWISAAGVTVLSAVMWPLVESFLGSGLHGPDMRRAVSQFNLTWMPAVALPMFAMAPLVEHHATWTLAFVSVACGGALLATPLLPTHPRPHDDAAAAGHVTDRYPALLRCARTLLPVSYLLAAALSPIVPYRLAEVGVEPVWQTPATATWMLARVAAVGLMLALPSWHGRWGPLGLAATALVGGFALVVVGPSIASMLVGFAVFGAGLGVVYTAALYYALAVHRADVDAGGTHEALIGLGYGGGPLLALVGVGLGGGPAIALVVAGTGLAAAAWAFTPWRAGRRRGSAGRIGGGDPGTGPTP